MAAVWGPVGPAAILLLAGGVGLWLFHSRSLGALALAGAAAALVLLPYARFVSAPMLASSPGAPHSPNLSDLGAFLLAVGAFTFGGGLTMIAFIQERSEGRR